MDFDFRLDFSTSCSTDEEPENYLTMISGTAVARDDEDEHRAGSLRLFQVDIEGAADAGCDPADILDMEDGPCWPVRAELACANLKQAHGAA